MKKRHLNSRRGTSLVEEICGVAVLMIVVAALLGAICVSSTTVSRNSAQENAAAKAQDIADTLVTKLSTSIASVTDTTDILGDGAVTHQQTSLGDFAAGEKQYTFQPIAASGTEPAGYSVKVRVFYNGGKNYTDIKAYASDTKGAFNK